MAGLTDIEQPQDTGLAQPPRFEYAPNVKLQQYLAKSGSIGYNAIVEPRVPQQVQPQTPQQEAMIPQGGLEVRPRMS